MRFKHFPLPVVALGILLSCAGCAAKHQPTPFEQVAAHLDYGGTYYQVSTPSAVIDSLQKAGAQLELAIQQSNLEPNDKGRLLLGTSAGAILWNLSGMQDIQGFGASSLRLNPGESSAFFLNRMYWGTTPDTTYRGFLWNLWGKSNRPLKTELDALPDCAILAFDVMMTPDALADSLKESGQITTEQLDRLCKGLLQIDFKTLLSEISGEYGLIIMAEPEAQLSERTGIHFVASIPDKSHRLEQKLLPLLQILLKNQLSDEFALEADWSEGQLLLYSSAKARSLFLDSPRLNESSPQFKAFQSMLQPEGIGFLYVSGELSRLVLESPGLAPLPEGLQELLPTQLAIFRHEQHGISQTAIANMDYNQLYLIASLLMPVANASNYLSEQHHKQTAKQEEQKQEQEARQAVAEKREKCLKHLELFNHALQNYAQKHDGKFPISDGKNGLKELFSEKLLDPQTLLCPATADEPAAKPEEFTFENCSFLYFGGFDKNSSPKFPLVFDWFGNHPDGVNLLYVDGSMEKIVLDNLTSCKRLVSYLQTQHRYNEKEFRLLLKKAVEIDRSLELE